MSSHAGEPEHLLTPAEVAALFRVDPKTVTRWAKAVHVDLSAFTALADFQKRVQERTAVQAALAAEGLGHHAK